MLVLNLFTLRLGKLTRDSAPRAVLQASLHAGAHPHLVVPMAAGSEPLPSPHLEKHPTEDPSVTLNASRPQTQSQGAPPSGAPCGRDYSAYS